MQYRYDAKNRLLTDSRANKKLSCTYDAVDNLLSKTDYQGQTTDFQYDSANRLVSMSNKAYLKAMYQFDPAGRLLSRVLSDGARSVYGYNADGQLTSLLMTTANNANTVTAYSAEAGRSFHWMPVSQFTACRSVRRDSDGGGV